MTVRPEPTELPTPEAQPRPDLASVQPTMVSQSGDKCPTCGAHLAADQRYCLECGHRRGDPRLPFMDAVVFMDAAKRPAQGPPSLPPPSAKRPRVSANASLIAGIGTLLLAMGIGVLIGKSGDQGSTPVGNAAPQVIKVEGGAGGGETASAGSKESSIGGDGGKSKKGKKLATDSSGTSEAAAEVLKPAGDVKLPPPTAQPGSKCESGAAGCKGGEFTGEFFGE